MHDLTEQNKKIKEAVVELETQGKAEYKQIENEYEQTLKQEQAKQKMDKPSSSSIIIHDMESAQYGNKSEEKEEEKEKTNPVPTSPKQSISDDAHLLTGMSLFPTINISKTNSSSKDDWDISYKK